MQRLTVPLIAAGAPLDPGNILTSEFWFGADCPTIETVERVAQLRSSTASACSVLLKKD